jgi:hypothetical protein
MASSIDIDRPGSSGAKRSLLVLFVPSVERDGSTPVAQEEWVRRALHTLGTLFGGATAYPKALGVWRDDERGVLVFDEPVVVHAYVAREAVESEQAQAILGAFCRELGRETHQGEVGLVVDDTYFAIRDFEE